MQKLALVSDVGGVLVSHDNAMMFDRLGALFAQRPSHAELIAQIEASGIGAGRSSAAGLFEALREKFGGAARLGDFLEAWSCHFAPKADVIGFYAGLNRELVLCSNTNAAHWVEVEARYGLESLAKATILSHLCGSQKPEAAIYLEAAKAHGRAPQDCLFVDDNPAFVEAAKALGFHGHVFADLAGLRAVLGG